MSSLRLPHDIRVVGETDDMAEALAAILDLRPDVALVAGHLKSASTLEAVTTLRCRRPRCGILMVTERSDAAEYRAFLGLGVAGYLERDDIDNETFVHCLVRRKNPDIVQVSRVAALAPPLPEPLPQASNPLGLDPEELTVLKDMDVELDREATAKHELMSLRKVDKVIARLYEKFDVEDRFHLAKRALQLGYIQ